MFLSASSRVTGGKAARGAAFMAGTQLAFINAFAPIGWVRVATFDDAVMRIVGSAAPASGGSNGFVATFNTQTVTGAHTLTIAEMPAHTHDTNIPLDNGAGGNQYKASLGPTTAGDQITQSTGGGGSHTHSITTSIKYVDVLIAKKT